LINIIADINISDPVFKAAEVFANVFGGMAMYVALIFAVITFVFFVDGKNYAATVVCLFLTYIFMWPILIQINFLLVIFGFVVAIIIAGQMYNSMVVKRNL